MADGSLLRRCVCCCWQPAVGDEGEARPLTTLSDEDEPPPSADRDPPPTVWQHARSLLREWGRAATWCYEHESFLYHYEMAQSDKDPLVYQIYERYASKADYLGAHRSSPAFKAFRPRMKALQDAGEVNVSGSSFVEIGLGFT